MGKRTNRLLTIDELPEVTDATLVLAFSGWMDGGEVSTGTVNRLIDLLDAQPFAEIDPEPFYIYNFPGSMEISALFRPSIDIQDGLIKAFEIPSNVFFSHPAGNLLLFVGKEPNLAWQSFADCIFEVARRTAVTRVLFVGSFGGSVPHTREPRLYVTCSDARELARMLPYGVRRSNYSGPASFVSFLMTQAQAAGLEMTSLVAEIPSYLQGANPPSIEAVTRRLAKILQLPLELDALRLASTHWEIQISSAIEGDAEMAEQVRQLEEEYDNDLLEQNEV